MVEPALFRLKNSSNCGLGRRLDVVGYAKFDVVGYAKLCISSETSYYKIVVIVNIGKR